MLLESIMGVGPLQTEPPTPPLRPDPRHQPGLDSFNPYGLLAEPSWPVTGAQNRYVGGAREQRFMFGDPPPAFGIPPRVRRSSSSRLSRSGSSPMAPIRESRSRNPNIHVFHSYGPRPSMTMTASLGGFNMQGNRAVDGAPTFQRYGTIILNPRGPRLRQHFQRNSDPEEERLRRTGNPHRRDGRVSSNLRSTRGTTNDIHSLMSQMFQNINTMDHDTDADDTVRPTNTAWPEAFNAIFQRIVGLAPNSSTGDYVFTDEAFDQFMTNAMEQNQSGNAPGPATQQAIDALPVRQLNAEDVGEGGQQPCAICTEDKRPGDEVMELPCHHWFCAECVKPWLKQHDTCPSCRSGIMPADGERTTARRPDQEPLHNEDPVVVARRQTFENPATLGREPPAVTGSRANPITLPESPAADRRRRTNDAQRAQRPRNLDMHTMRDVGYNFLSPMPSAERLEQLEANQRRQRGGLRGWFSRRRGEDDQDRRGA